MTSHLLPRGTTERVLIGALSDFSTFPHLVLIGSKRYFLVQIAGNGGYQLLSATCPHMGGGVVCTGAALACPVHGWSFDATTGSTVLGQSGTGLEVIEALVEGEQVYALLNTQRSRPGVSHQKTGSLPESLVVKLHAHACLEICWDGLSVLFDPWLDGPAFMGSWIQYPGPTVSASGLHPDIIVLTHEHSDHFHERTLRHFPRTTTFVVPDFPNQRMQKRLAQLGFCDVRPILFGERFELADDAGVVFYGPTHCFNDAIVLLELGGGRILNLNDAGINAALATQIGPVDLVASAFSIGASAYPLAWDHLEPDKQESLQVQFAAGKLQMLKTAVELYQADYVLPFAGHFTLWHPSHRALMQSLKKNTVDDVSRAFADLPAEVIDLMPGEEWTANGGSIGAYGTGARRFADHAAVHSREAVLAYVEHEYDAAVFAQTSFEPAASVSDGELDLYFLRFNQVPELAFCEDLLFRIKLFQFSDREPLVERTYAVRRGRIAHATCSDEEVDLEISLPSGVFKRIVEEALPWDEGYIGYWCQMRKREDPHHFGFWRLLHTPQSTLRRDDYVTAGAEDPPVGPSTVIAGLIERHGEVVTRILHRHGLYCSGCALSMAESLHFGATAHALGAAQLSRLIAELNSALGAGLDGAD